MYADLKPIAIPHPAPPQPLRRAHTPLTVLADNPRLANELGRPPARPEITFDSAL